MNDPNGFSKVGNHFHLFYQHYPHSFRWKSMHWGHAVSTDLINWVCNLR
jgi:beta-fructofuranosidase